MNTTDIDTIIKKHLHRVAPEADLETLEPNEDLGRALDIDSMDFYNMMVAISEELKVDIPEEEYGKLRSLNRINQFLTESINK
ncbi:acyl carrier protein [Aliifodinibius sp. S!AR15-10]|uniref:acyl carrier protein n=1 Tax=Aliifodinibius sp. S!AR15-10 TaxID=2950437 RepID=UPI002866FAC1|nr:acyl carrier protein [Aliifodinibius sp. S!AR15-10]MDR8393947.1 acyl carrier protein [Aliifodinibius sp. S!AR15-10]